MRVQFLLGLPMKYSFKRMNPATIQVKVVNNEGIIFGAYFNCFNNPSKENLEALFKHRFDLFWIEAEVTVEEVKPDKLAMVKYKS